MFTWDAHAICTFVWLIGLGCADVVWPKASSLVQKLMVHQPMVSSEKTFRKISDRNVATFLHEMI